MELPHFFIIQELFADLSVQFLNFSVQVLFFFIHAVQPPLQLADLPLNLRVISASNPLDGVLLCLFNITDSLKNIGNIVDASFLDLQDINCHVEINGHVFAIFDEVDKLFSQDGKAIILPATATLFVSLAVDAEVIVLLVVVQELLLNLRDNLLSHSFSHASDNIIQESKLLFSRSLYAQIKIEIIIKRKVKNINFDFFQNFTYDLLIQFIMDILQS